MNETLYVLRAARAAIAHPDNWGKGMRRSRGLDTCCVAEAIEETWKPSAKRFTNRAIELVYCAAGLELKVDHLFAWNDADERTHEEVLKTLDLAIAIARG